MVAAQLRRLAVLTSGGDAPGMNAAIRAVVRYGIDAGAEVVGVERGYSGLLAEEFVPLGARDVGGIIHQGGTVLGTSRCPELKTPAGIQAAACTLRRHGFDALVVIGGSGSQRGACAIDAAGFPVVGVASTIDNDLYGSEVTIGVDTALNVALEAIDRLKVTATSHQRAFLVETMGRDCGYLALMAGIAGGADAIVIPECETDPEELAAELQQAYTRGKRHALVVVAEGAPYNGYRLHEYFSAHRDRLGYDLRVTTLGHVQRGGAPGAYDRLLATRLGVAAVQRLLCGRHGVLVGLQDGRVAETPLAEVAAHKKTLDLSLLDMARTLAR